jgi:hypothetical protein
LRFVAVALALLVAPPVASALDLQVSARDDGPVGAQNERAQWFEVAGQPGRDPTVRVAPGDVVHVAFENDGTHAHSLHLSFGPQTPLLAPHERATLDLVVPAKATWGAYWCDAHRVAGMVGVLDLGTGIAAPTVSESRLALIPAAQPVLALALALALAVALRRRIA